MRESADFHTNATPTFVGTRLRENPGRNPRRAPENTPWARTMLQPLHPYGAVLNLDVIDFRNMEKLIDEWVAAIKIAATTLELDKENFIKLVELSLEGSVKIGWDNTPADTKASILAGDSKSAIADRLGRLIKIHFIEDGYFEGSRTEKAREYAQALFSLELRTPIFFAKICSPWRKMLIQSYKVPEGQMDSVENQGSQEKGGNTGVIYTPGIPEELLSGEDHGGPKSKPEHTNMGNGVDQQGLHPKDLDEQRQDPQEEPLPEERSDGPIPGRMKVSKIATAGHVEQEDISLQTARRNVNNYSEEDRLQTSESLLGFFSRMTVSNKTMERIMRQDSNLSPYDGFRIGGIGKVLNQIGLNQRKHHIIYKVSSGEFAIPMEFTGNVMEMQLIPKEEILEELSRLREEIAVTMKWIHIGTIEVVIKATFKEGIDSEIHLSIMDRRINNLRDGCLGTMIGNLYAGKLMFDIHPRIAYNLADQDFSRVLTLHQDFKRKDLMKEGNRPYSITYRIAYALSNTHHSDLFLRKQYIEIPRIFKEFAKVMTPDPIRIPRIGGVDIVIRDHPVLDRTMSSRIEYGSRMSFSEDRITGYKGKEKDLTRVLTPQEIKQPVVGRYEGMLEIAGHEFLVAGVAGRENRKGFFTEILILNTGIREAKIMIGGAFGTPWFRVLRREKAFNRIMPINFRSKRGDVDTKLTHPKMQDKRKFGKVLLSFRQQGLIDSDSFYEESEEEIKNLREALRNFSENPLAWWDRNKIEATLKIKEECKYEYVRYKPIQMNMEDKKDMQIIIKEHINLGLIEPGISAYSSPGFLIKMENESKKFTAFSTPQGIELQEHIVEKIRNFPDVLKDKKQLQSFLGVVNFAGIFIKDLAKYRKDFPATIERNRKCKWKWRKSTPKGFPDKRWRDLKQTSVMLET
ncbi:movement protein [Sesamum angolense]|uniref:Movement protein n=1 Tax=Sesamum angolense TaxID=2727404 RepID=A0AAE1T289_9LAMI|nr:movement protein [Sesamum angolense]